MRVMVTGAEGFIGQAVAEGLRQAGHEVVGYDCKSGQWLSDTLLLRRVMAGCEVVVHLAGIPWPDPKKEWATFWEWNCQGTEAVARAAVDVGVRRVIYASSTAYYGAEEKMRPVWEVDGGPAAEGARNAVQVWRAGDMPSGREAAVFYAGSKVIAEAILATFGLRRALEVVVLRLCPTSDDCAPWLWGLYTRRWRVVETIRRMVEEEEPLWYEVFNVAEDDVDVVSRAKLDQWFGGAE